ncbi:MAG TPA: cytochrome b N-terminal domain-containing protein [bacterium]|nr:cytochrome b N-terminal domain-containing protein [bacterium]
MTTKTSGLGLFWQNVVSLPSSLRESFARRSAPTSDRARSQSIFANIFLHIHSTRVHPHALRLSYTWGLGVASAALFFILTVTGVLLMIYYKPSTELAYQSIKDLHYVVPTGRFIRNIHRWAAQLMVITVLLHMARVFYTGSYKKPREFNWVIGLGLFVLTLALSFTGYLLPWDQLAYWAITIGANIAASPTELTDAIGITHWFNIGAFQKELLLGASEVGEDALIRFYVLHVMILPILLAIGMSAHIWRVRKDGGLSRPGRHTTAAGKGVGASQPVPQTPSSSPTKTYGLMCVVKGKTPATDQNLDETVPSWPYLLRAELLVLMVFTFFSLVLAYFFDAPLKELANPSVPENPAKAPWYFLGLQEMVSYSAFIGGVVVPAVAMIGLALIPYLDREREQVGVWFSGAVGRVVAWRSLVFGAIAAVAMVAIPVNFGWLRNWFPGIPQLWIILINPGTILTALYVLWSVYELKRSGSTRMAAIALFTCFLVGFAILTTVGTVFRGPNWDFYWWPSQWPTH